MTFSHCMSADRVLYNIATCPNFISEVCASIYRHTTLSCVWYCSAARFAPWAPSHLPNREFLVGQCWNLRNVAVSHSSWLFSLQFLFWYNMLCNAKPICLDMTLFCDWCSVLIVLLLLLLFLRGIDFTSCECVMTFWGVCDVVWYWIISLSLSLSLSLSHRSELISGTLSSNSIEDGTEIRLVPAVESGVTVCVCVPTYPCLQCTYVHVCVGVNGKREREREGEGGREGERVREGESELRGREHLHASICQSYR